MKQYNLVKQLMNLAVKIEDEKEKRILLLQARVLQLEIENEKLKRKNL